MRSQVILKIVGSFLQIFGAMMAVPVAVALYFSESPVYMAGFALPALASVILGYSLYISGKHSDYASNITIPEAIFATVLGWILAVMFGAIPFLMHMHIFNALFESSAGLTTTGISMVLDPSTLPKSLLFWRSFIQWIGGLGILTFFVAVIRESGGVTRRLYSAEAHKTDSGSIRPSLEKSIASLWRVYGFLTFLFIAVYIALGMPVFDSIMHAFSGISTGGFSTQAGSIGAYSKPIQIVTIPLMFLGGVNFVLLYKFLRSEFDVFIRSTEFKLYTAIFLLIGSLTAFNLFTQGSLAGDAVLNGFFTSAAVISSTGYATIGITTLSAALQFIFIGVMFVGGSLGSTAGGFKVFRLKAMYELVKTRIRAYQLPESAINEAKIDGEIVKNSTVRTISVLFFGWIALIFLSTIVVLVADQTTFIAALSGSVSAAGNMGPVYMPAEKMVALSPITKVTWVIVMLAGRLELLPLLAIFNRELFQDSK
ncbi:MAG: TrkH family potassium uptake protein [Candidatus Nanohaloarchaea archaeon]